MADAKLNEKEREKLEEDEEKIPSLEQQIGCEEKRSFIVSVFTYKPQERIIHYD